MNYELQFAMRSRQNHVSMKTTTFLKSICLPPRFGAIASRLSILVLSLMVMPASVQADNFGDFSGEVVTRTFIITEYTGSRGTLIIPYKFKRWLKSPWPVTGIWKKAFFEKNCLTSVAIPNSVQYIGDLAFGKCTNLTAITFGDSLHTIGAGAFLECECLTNVTVGNNVTNIGAGAFLRCRNLTAVSFGDSLTSIGENAFGDCSRLTSVNFRGNAPRAHASAFTNAPNAVIYYSPGTTGWGKIFSGRPTALISKSSASTKLSE